MGDFRINLCVTDVATDLAVDSVIINRYERLRHENTTTLAEPADCI